MKTKEHQFVVTVKTTKTKAGALSAILCAFACRQPDGCEFNTIDRAAFNRNQRRRILRACEETRQRMNTYTPEQREELHKNAMEFIRKCSLKRPSP